MVPTAPTDRMIILSVPYQPIRAESFFGVYEEMQRETKLQQAMMAGLNVEKLLADDPRITSGEYLAAFLKEMGFVTTEDIEPVLNRFKVLDVDKSGFHISPATDDRTDIMATCRASSMPQLVLNLTGDVQN